MQFEVQFIRVDNFVIRKLSDDMILVPVNQTGAEVQKIYVMNLTAAALWRYLEFPRTIEDIVSFFDNDYFASEGVIKKDITKMLQELIEDNIVRVFERE